MPKSARFIFAGLGLIVLDQITKFYFLYFQPQLVVINSGGAFSISSGWVYYPFVVVLVLLLLLVLLIKSNLHKRYPWAVVLVYAGAIGDLIDRFRLGGVVDFINLRIWPSFNLADAMIVIGFLWLAFVVLFGSQKKTPKA